MRNVIKLRYTDDFNKLMEIDDISNVTKEDVMKYICDYYNYSQYTELSRTEITKLNGTKLEKLINKFKSIKIDNFKLEGVHLLNIFSNWSIGPTQLIPLLELPNIYKDMTKADVYSFMNILTDYRPGCSIISDLSLITKILNDIKKETKITFDEMLPIPFNFAVTIIQNKSLKELKDLSKVIDLRNITHTSKNKSLTSIYHMATTQNNNQLLRVVDHDTKNITYNLGFEDIHKVGVSGIIELVENGYNVLVLVGSYLSKRPENYDSSVLFHLLGLDIFKKIEIVTINKNQTYTSLSEHEITSHPEVVELLNGLDVMVEELESSGCDVDRYKADSLKSIIEFSKYNTCYNHKGIIGDMSLGIRNLIECSDIDTTINDFCYKHIEMLLGSPKKAKEYYLHESRMIN